uniref:VanZ-like domain-containing protein n=1 Tax=viral metagenome TaxID=1070528 RepID=A0A6M3K0M1_9ZZZZ
MKGKGIIIGAILFWVVVYCLLVTGKCDAQENWRWSKNGWNSKCVFTEKIRGTIFEYDKIQHGTACFLGYGTLRLLGMPKKKAFFVIMGLGLVNEIKDALIPYETYGLWGGEGFDYKDVIANMIGIVAFELIEFIWKQINFSF